MKNGIGRRLINSFLFIIIFIVFIVDIFVIFGFKNMYYNSIENELKNRLLVSISYFKKFYSRENIQDLLLEDSDFIWTNDDLEIQILDSNGYIIFDNIGFIQTDMLTYDDIMYAKEGNIKSWIGSNNFTNESMMAVTEKLKNDKNITIGYLRFISSLNKANDTIFKVTSIVLALSITIIIATATVSVLVARSIVKPIKELKTVAEKMADGQYKVRSSIKNTDEIGQLSKALNLMAEEILKKEQIKNDFISSISHELRTPLTSIKGWAVVLRNAKDEEDIIDDGLNIIENEADRLAKMVEDLLDFSRFISGRINLEKYPFNIVALCEDVVKQMKPRSISNDINLMFEAYESKIFIIGDESRIRQVLINLIDNAIKFTQTNGWIKIRAFVELENFIILVSDNGIGISENDLKHIKEKFYKGKHSKSHSGIGLSIADEIIRLHNGNIEIFSEENIGTTIRISIPLTSNKKEESDINEKI